MVRPQTLIALIRGINVGGSTLIKMDALKNAFAGLGLRNVKTVLASGNVIFETDKADREALTEKIQGMLKETFHLDPGLILCSAAEIQALIAADPFKEITITPNTRLYVTFLMDGIQNHSRKPFISPEGDFGVVRIFEREICTFVELSTERGTPELMRAVDQEYGRQVTTRSWNTILKIGRLLG